MANCIKCQDADVHFEFNEVVSSGRGVGGGRKEGGCLVYATFVLGCVLESFRYGVSLCVYQSGYIGETCAG